jgi:hypothetical protein
MRNIILGLLFLTFSTVFLSCSKQIKGDENEVKELLTQLVQEEIKNQFVNELLVSEYSTSPKMIGNPTYQTLKEHPEDGPATNIVAMIDTTFSKLTFKLEDIRINEKNKELNKVVCSATMNVNGLKPLIFDLKYSAQLTTDTKKYFVELIKMDLKN